VPTQPGSANKSCRLLSSWRAHELRECAGRRLRGVAQERIKLLRVTSITSELLSDGHHSPEQVAEALMGISNPPRPADNPRNRK
jgi:hypothetical protein